MSFAREFAREFAGLIAEIMAIAGLDLAVKQMGVEMLRMVERLAGFNVPS